jgi:protein ImuA
MKESRASILSQLQREILPLQGYKPALHNKVLDADLGPIRHSFPGSKFPLGAVHEFICDDDEGAAATFGFVSALAASLMHSGGTAFWIGPTCTTFPPALKAFGLEPERILFVELKNEKDILWAVEEALKCGALAAVVGEVRNLTFNASRRLQLAVERSKVTGFLFRRRLQKLDTTASLTRWKISPTASMAPDDLPGVGFPQWKIELLKVRNGRTGSWQVQWIEKRFRFVQHMAVMINKEQKKVG